MDEIKRLPDSELEVMLIIWQRAGEIHTGEILQALNARRPSNLQAVQSTLGRLQNKGFIGCNKVGRLNYYAPLVEEGTYRDLETGTFLERMYHNSPVKLVAALLEKQAMSPGEIAEIRRLLEGEDA